MCSFEENTSQVMLPQINSNVVTKFAFFCHLQLKLSSALRHALQAWTSSRVTTCKEQGVFWVYSSCLVESYKGLGWLQSHEPIGMNSVYCTSGIHALVQALGSHWQHPPPFKPQSLRELDVGARAAQPACGSPRSQRA